MGLFDDIGGAIGGALDDVASVGGSIVSAASSVANSTIGQAGLTAVGTFFGDPSLGSQVSSGLATAKGVLGVVGGVGGLLKGGQGTPAQQQLTPAQKSAQVQAALLKAGFRTSTITGKDGMRYSLVSYKGKVTKVTRLGYAGTAPTFTGATAIGAQVPVAVYTPPVLAQSGGAAGISGSSITATQTPQQQVTSATIQVAQSTNEAQLQNAQAVLTQALSKANSGGGGGGLAVVSGRRTKEQ